MITDLNSRGESSEEVPTNGHGAAGDPAAFNAIAVEHIAPGINARHRSFFIILSLVYLV